MTVKIRELRIKADFTRNTAPTEYSSDDGIQTENSVAQRDMVFRNAERSKSRKSSRER